MGYIQALRASLPPAYGIYGGDSETAYIHDLDTNTLLYSISMASGRVKGADANANYSIIGASYGDYKLINNSDGSTVYSDNLTDINDVAISKNYWILADGFNGRAWLYSISDGSQLASYTEMGSNCRAVGTTDTYASYGEYDGYYFLKDIDTGTLLYEFTQETSGAIQAGANSDDWVAYGGNNNTAYVHDITDGSLTYEFTESSSGIEAMDIHKDKIIYAGDDDNAYVHDLGNGDLLYTLTEATNSILGAGISERYVLYGDVDGNTYVHDLSNGNLLYTLTEEGTIRGAGVTG